MKVLSFDPDLCVGCGVCEEVCSETWFKEIDPERSRIRIVDRGEPTLHALLCNQCGECISVCPTEALYRNKQGIVLLRKSLCVGCYSCVGFCPYEAMFYHPASHEPFKCVVCGKCVPECPAEALSIVERETASAS